MKLYLFVILFAFSLNSFSQFTLKGKVQNKKQEAIFAANVYLKSKTQNGVTTDFEGRFKIQINNLNDTLIVSFIGFETKEICISTMNLNENNIVILDEKSQTLEEIIITAQDPISEQFSVVKMKKLDIYLNPVSQGDPLKAITVLPASTTINETANPSLRGSSPDRSRVILNGVPIYKPVKASQLNNQGFFSLFNPEIINKQYIYASNPPLTYGNTSAGLVEIQTIRKLKSNQLQISSSLASVGVFLSQKINKDISFIQIYGNYQFSDAFVSIQKENLPNIKNFYTKDAGLNFHTKIGKRVEFNSFNYYINETFQGHGNEFTYKGNVETNNKRIFTVNNFKYFTRNGIISLNSGTNKSIQNFNFGNIFSENKTNQVYNSLDYKYFPATNTNLQFGVSHDFQNNKFNDSIPYFYYALSPVSPNYFSEISVSNHILEAYLYTKWDINDKLSFSLGLRSNLPVNNQKYYLSSQLGIKYRLNRKHIFLLSGGKYHNYSMSNFYSKKHNLLSSYQVALDYTYEFKNSSIKAASYFKNEQGEQTVNAYFSTDKINTFGLELYLKHNFYKYFNFSFANSFINQTMKIYDKTYKGQKDFNYLIKTSLQYNNPRLFSLTLSYISRPGTYYNSIINSTFDNQTGFCEPIFSTALFTSQYTNYKRLDISLSKYISLKRKIFIIFASFTNVLNTKNESEALYNNNYSNKYFDYYQSRTIYFGFVWQLNY